MYLHAMVDLASVPSPQVWLPLSHCMPQVQMHCTPSHVCRNAFLETDILHILCRTVHSRMTSLGAQATQVQLAQVRPWLLRAPVHSQAPPLLRDARDARDTYVMLSHFATHAPRVTLFEPSFLPILLSNPSQCSAGPIHSIHSQCLRSE